MTSAYLSVTCAKPEYWPIEFGINEGRPNGALALMSMAIQTVDTDFWFAYLMMDTLRLYDHKGIL